MQKDTSFAKIWWKLYNDYGECLANSKVDFTRSERQLYDALLRFANRQDVKSLTFYASNIQLNMHAKLGPKGYRLGRDGLKQHGLIDYQIGHHGTMATIYKLIPNVKVSLKKPKDISLPNTEQGVPVEHPTEHPADVHEEVLTEHPADVRKANS